MSDPGAAVVREIAEHPFGTPTFTGRQWPLADVRLLAPILASKVVCMGKNYAAHAREMGSEPPEDPVIFLKPNTAIIGPNIPIQLPADANPVHHEGELAVVIERPCKDVPAAKAKDFILGYTIANDVSAHDQQRKDGQWMRAKGHDTFCPVGPWIDTDVDPFDLELRTEVNGELDCLRAAIPAALDALRPGGRIAVEAYQSLEDRIVKGYFTDAIASRTPEGLPMELPGYEPLFTSLTRGAERADEHELELNPRSASVRLRALEKVVTRGGL